MAKTVVIVESPAKAKTIEKILGRDYTVRASVGHIRDLPDRGLGVDVEADFAPTYEVKRGKAQVVKDLQKAIKGARSVLIATDPDREGEAIGWHVAHLLELNPQEKVRVTFNEITKKVVQEAVKRPRPIDMHLVDAQQARRVLDRLVGFGLSPVLSLKFRKRALSAGRVQSVALRLVVEREDEIEAFVPQEYWTLEADFGVKKGVLTASLYSVDKERVQKTVQGETKFLITTKAAMDGVLTRAKAATYSVSAVERKERRRGPAPPFTTSSLQQAAGGRFGWSASRTMRVAQKLYEGIDFGKEGSVGLITYMRTDSLRVSPEALNEVRDYIPKTYGKSYLPETANFYRGKKAAQTQDAHEAIRPTSALRTPEAVARWLSPEQLTLYRLIWQRFVASQMTPAVFDGTTVTVSGGGLEFRATGSVLKFDGFLRVYNLDEDEVTRALPEVSEGEEAKSKDFRPEQKFTQPPPRYNDSSLVKTLEEKGIGRPSTYAPTIETLVTRSYVEREGRALKPTPLGRHVTYYLLEHFPKVMQYEFTASLEDELDSVEEGGKHWPQAVRTFYEPFTEELSGVEREHCPECGGVLEVKLSRFGQFLGCSNYPSCNYTRPIEEKAEPIPIGEKCPESGHELVLKTGRYGDFIACSGYPECKYTRAIVRRTGFECPKCREGEVVEKRSRKGRTFWGCERYPACDFSTFYPLVDERCELCGFSKMEMPSGLSCSNPECSAFKGRRFSKSESKAKRAVKKTTGKRAKPKGKGAAKGAGKATAKDLEAFLGELTSQDAEVVARLEGMRGKRAQNAKGVAGELRLSEDEVKAAHKRGMFKLRMAFGKARKEAQAA